MIELLLSFGADPNALDEMGGTTAQWAAGNGHIDAIRILLDTGMDPSADGRLALRLALSKGHLEIARLLVERGARIDMSCILAVQQHGAKNANKMAMLLFCVEGLATATASERGLDSADEPNALVKWDTFSVPILMQNGDYYLSAALLEHEIGTGTADLSDSGRALLFCICTEYNLQKGIFHLLAAGPVTKSMQQFGVLPYRWTALQIAIYKGHFEVVEQLCAQGWDPIQEDCDGRMALDLAAGEGHYGLVQDLVASRGAAEHRDRAGNTPMMHAAKGPRSDDMRILEALDRAGCDVSKANVYGETALHAACERDYGAAVEWLLVKGSSNSAGNSISLAAVADQAGNTPLHTAASANATAAIFVLLAHNADVHAKAVSGATPLHQAAEKGAGAAIVALLAAGADPNMQDMQGRTALVVAVSAGRCDITTLEELLHRTTINWEAPHPTNLLFATCLAQEGSRKTDVATLECVLAALRAAKGAKTRKIVARLMPELVAALLSTADEENGGALADTLRLLLNFLPKSKETRHMLIFHMLIAIIKHGGDDDAELARTLLLLDDDSVSQALPGMWGLLHLACKYGRIKTVRVLVSLGASFVSSVEIDGTVYAPLDIAEKYSPSITGTIDGLIHGAGVLLKAIENDQELLPLIRSLVLVKPRE